MNFGSDECSHALYPAKSAEINDIVPYQKNFRSSYITFKKKISTCACMGHKWVICGSHPGCSVGWWVKFVNGCDPLPTLQEITGQMVMASNIIIIDINHKNPWPLHPHSIC